VNLYSYVVARDYGFAPNPFFGVCTLATCKPRIRHAAQIGDWVVGTGSKRHRREKHTVYAMRVTDAMTFSQYWSDPRFQRKRPNLRGSKKQAFGDSIYSWNARTKKWCQANSHHSMPDGSPNKLNIATDTQADRVLISDDFVYWGGSGPRLPQKFLNYGPQHISLCAGRGHKSSFPPDFVQDFVAWIRSLNEKGYVGEPLDWSRTP
jgi:putative DNA base modification enzyme with NMAD domain